MPDELSELEDIQRVKYELWAAEPPATSMFKAAQKDRIVAEGDSWFDYSPGFDVLDNLKGNHKLAIYKVAEGGDTLENMSYGTEIRSNYTRKPPQLTQTLEAVRDFKSKVVLLSGGGNDIAGPELAAFLNHGDSGLPPLREDYARAVFAAAAVAYKYIFGKIWEIDPKVHIIFHGYGHPIPDGRAVKIVGIRFAGPWLRPFLARKGIEGEIAERVMRQLIDMFNDMLTELAKSDQQGRLHYLDLRSHIGRDDWVNELHLTNKAFARVADVFAAEIKQWSGS
jgi:hypothetical protein